MLPKQHILGKEGDKKYLEMAYSRSVNIFSFETMINNDVILCGINLLDINQVINNIKFMKYSFIIYLKGCCVQQRLVLVLGARLLFQTP